MEKISKKSIVMIFLLSIFVAFSAVGLYFVNRTEPNQTTIAVDGPTNSGNWTDSGNYASTFAGGDGSEGDPYLISTPDQLALLSKNASSYKGRYFLQTADLNMSAYYWTPIGTESTQFYGHYDGGGFEISGIYVGTEASPQVNYAGLFGCLHAKGGGGSSRTSISNITLTNSVIFGSGKIGGIVGGVPQVSVESGFWTTIYTTISNCISYADIYCPSTASSSCQGGGIIGFAYATAIENCENYGQITNLSNSETNRVGGIVGYLMGGRIAYCKNYGAVSSFGTDGSGGLSTESGAGGIAGASSGVISYSSNYGTVEGHNAGGICGVSGTITSCSNFADVSANRFAGGIVAINGYGMISNFSTKTSIHSYYTTGDITNCYNRGNVQLTIDASSSDGLQSAGGICAVTLSLRGSMILSGNDEQYIHGDPVNISNNYNTGTVSNLSSEGYAGGILGAIQNIYYIKSIDDTTIGKILVPLNLNSNFNIGGVSSVSGIAGAIVGDLDFGIVEISKNYYGAKALSSLLAVGQSSADQLTSDASYLDGIDQLAKTVEWYQNSQNWDENAEWDFNSVWKIDTEQNDGYPILNMLEEMTYWSSDGIRATAFADGDGSEGDPYQISSGAELGYLSYMTANGNYYENQYFIQTSHIDLSGYYWDPIDNFRGHYNGQNYEITHLTTPPIVAGSMDEEAWMASGSEANSKQGLFGDQTYYYRYSPNLEVTIENIILKDSTIYATEVGGGIVASVGYDYVNYTINNCINYADVICYGYSVGGVVGEACSSMSAGTGTINNCKNYGDIVLVSTKDAESRAGGVIGNGERRASVYNSENHGSITASFIVNTDGSYNGSYYASSSSAGGVIGEGSVTNCSNYGMISVSSSSSTSDFNYLGLTVGGVVGFSDENITLNCFNQGNINVNIPESSYISAVGGVGGYVGGITNSYNTGNIEADDNGNIVLGGVVGASNKAGSIINCYSSGNITANGANSVIGGVVGYFTEVSNNYYSSSSAIVMFSFNSGNLSSNYAVGGILGTYPYSASTSSYLIVGNTFNVGSVAGADGFTGAIVAEQSDLSVLSVFNTYYGGNANQMSDIGSGENVGATYLDNISSLAKTKEWFLSDAWSVPWNFYSCWGFVDGENNGYPVFNSSVQGSWIDEEVWKASGKNLENYSFVGSGTENDPYLIQSEWDLAYLSYLVNNNLGDVEQGDQLDMGLDEPVKLQFAGKHFKQTADIDLSKHLWTAIGGLDIEALLYISFSGNYDGGGFDISGMYTVPSEYEAGLFGVMILNDKPATIQNVNITDSYIMGMMQSSSVATMVISLSAEISFINCHNSSTIVGNGAVGIAYPQQGPYTVENCSNNGDILGYGGNAIGIVHNGYGGTTATISNCYNTGNVIGMSQVAGIAGRVTGGTISDSYNTGDIIALTGSACGVVNYLDSSSIYNCYNTGNITSLGGSSSYGVSGVVGQASYDGADGNVSVENCVNYGNVESMGTISNVGGVVGINGGSYSYYRPATVSNCTNYGNVAGYNYVGGVIGYSDQNSTSSTLDPLSNLTNYGDVSGNDYVGGIVGRTDSLISNANNSGAVSGNSYIGGVAGYLSCSVSQSSTNLSFMFDMLQNYGPVSAISNYAGGIFGYFTISSSNTLPVFNFTKCLNLGSVSSQADYVGGLIGYLTVSGSSENYPVTITFENCGAESNLHSTGQNIAVLVGYSNHATSFESCYAISNFADKTIVGTTEPSISNSLFILNNQKYYCGDNFADFIWINTSSSPVPICLAHIGQFWPGTVTLDNLLSAGWQDFTI